MHTYFRQINVKRFALSTIASAIFTLHAETASAISCPAEIIGTPLANTICNFDTGSSVTVKNGGSVGGIAMNAYNPASPSQIVIDVGGIINSNSLGSPGIAISNSLLSNGISNNGTISNSTGSGITISNTSTISGGLSNSGLISTSNLGIAINHSNINDGILNSGIITSTNGSGISIAASSTVNGGITNSGTITAGGVDVGIAIINQSTVNGTISNSGLIEASNGDGIIMYGSSTINGSISNSGTIKSNNQTGVAILNLSNVLGDISNSGMISGDVQGLSIHNASTVAGNILNSGTISSVNGKGISIYSSTTISGSISNSGTITGGNTGIAVTSSSIVNGGISNSGTIQGDIYAMRIGFNSNVSHIDILGQNARVIGAVNAPSTTFNITPGTVFTSEGTFDVNIFNIDTNAIFNMLQSITANTMNNAGTLNIRNTIQTISGNYLQSANSLFQIGVTSATDYGQLVVTGTADLSNSGNINVQIAQNASLHHGDVLANVINGNVLIEPTNGFNVSDNSFLWKFSANTSNNTSVNLTAAINPIAYGTCQGDYCQGAANTIIEQIAAGNSLFNPYVFLSTESAFKTAASQATPELTNENVQAIQFITQSVMDIVPMWSTLHGTSAGDAMLYQQGKIWLKPYGGSMTQNENNTVDGFNATAYGIVIGKDMQLPDDWLFGGAVAVGKDNLDGKSLLDGQSIDSDDYQGMLYAAKQFPYHLYVAAQGLIGYGDNNTKRSIPLYASTVDGSYNSWFTNLRAQLGWSTYAFHEDLVFTPVIDASYLFVNQGSYQETGSVMDLKVSANNNSFLVLGVYGHGAYRLMTLQNQQDLALTGYVGVARDVLNSNPEIEAAFVAGGPSFSTMGVQFNEFVFRGGIGLTLANPTKPLRVNLNYDLQAGNNAYSGVGTLAVTYKI